EVSMISEQILLKIDERLQQALNCAGTPFGGLGLLLMGDFMQLPPVSSKPLYVSMQNPAYALNHELRQWPVIEFKQQMRAVRDKEHTARLERQRNVSATATPLLPSD